MPHTHISLLFSQASIFCFVLLFRIFFLLFVCLFAVNTYGSIDDCVCFSFFAYIAIDNRYRFFSFLSICCCCSHFIMTARLPIFIPHTHTHIFNIYFFLSSSLRLLFFCSSTWLQMYDFSGTKYLFVNKYIDV